MVVAGALPVPQIGCPVWGTGNAPAMVPAVFAYQSHSPTKSLSLSLGEGISYVTIEGVQVLNFDEVKASILYILE